MQRHYQQYQLHEHIGNNYTKFYIVALQDNGGKIVTEYPFPLFPLLFEKFRSIDKIKSQISSSSNVPVLMVKRYIGAISSKHTSIKDMATNEITLLTKLNNHDPYILPLIDNFTDQGDACLLFPFTHGGSLAEVLQHNLRTPPNTIRTAASNTVTSSSSSSSSSTPFYPLPFVALRQLAYQLIQAIQHLHSHNIVHRDVRPENILLMVPEISKAIGTIINPSNDKSNTTRPNSRIVRSSTTTLPLAYDKLWPTHSTALSKYDYVLSDFGKATMLDDTGLANNFLDSHLCMAPELLCVEPYGKAVDIFCYGAVLFTCATGHVVGSTREERMMLINESWCVSTILDQASSDVQTYWNKLPTAFQDMIESCLAPDPKNRPTADTLFNDSLHLYARYKLQARNRIVQQAEQAMKATPLQKPSGTTTSSGSHPQKQQVPTTKSASTKTKSDTSSTKIPAIDKSTLEQFNRITRTFPPPVTDKSVKVVVQVMRGMKQDSGIQFYGCAYLMNSSSTIVHAKNEAFTVNPGSIECILSAICNHPNVSAIQSMGFGALVNLWINVPSFQAIFVDQGGIPIIVSAMRNQINESNVQIQGCILLAKLGSHSNNLALIADQGGIEAIANAMKYHSQCTEVQNEGCKALKLLTADRSLLPRVTGTNVVPLIRQAMQLHRKNTEIQKNGQICLSFLLP